MCLRALWSKLGDAGGQQGEESRSVLRDALRSSNEEVQCNQAAVALTPVQSVLFLSGVGFTSICDLRLYVIQIQCCPIQVKVTAFGMLCERRRTTDAPAVADLSAIISFLPDNMSSQSPLFRQQIQACLKQVSCVCMSTLQANVYVCTVCNCMHVLCMYLYSMYVFVCDVCVHMYVCVYVCMYAVRLFVHFCDIVFLCVLVCVCRCVGV